MTDKKPYSLADRPLEQGSATAYVAIIVATATPGLPAWSQVLLGLLALYKFFKEG